MSAEHALQLRGVGREFSGLWALDGIDLTVDRGRVLVVLGHNGSGKTTMLRVAAGRLEPTEGSVRVLGARLATREGQAYARRHVGFVLDAPVFYPDLTVEEHLGLVSIAYEVSAAADRIDELLDRFDLDEHRSVLPDHLSSGMRQKLQLACVLLRPAQVLLLDEPTRGLDPRTRDILWTLLAERRRAGAAIVLTTHHLDLPADLPDDGAVLVGGELAAAGPYADVLASQPVRDLGLA